MSLSSRQSAEPIDPLDEILNLENQYYTEGYNLGVADGARSGRIEGRVFGLDKGFEKFLEMGRLNGKATVWKSRLDPPGPTSENPTKASLRLDGSERLQKHVARLEELTDPKSLLMENNEDAVSEFDDRLKDAKAKAMLIRKIVREDQSLPSVNPVGFAEPPHESKEQSTLKQKANAQQSKEMEDFIGLPRSKLDAS